MGSRGPAPEPTHLKIVKGTATAEDLAQEPLPTEGPITPPSWLSTKARNVWLRLAPDLITKGVLTPWDVDQFARFCALEAVNRDAYELVLRDGVLVKGDKGLLVKNPAIQVLRDTQQLLTTLSGLFGLTPSSRTQLKIGDGGKGPSRGADRLLS